ncbi:IS3 family transposase [Fusibacter sp. JL216-2]
MSFNPRNHELFDYVNWYNNHRIHGEYYLMTEPVVSWTEPFRVDTILAH